jgi:hypothetical protein
MEKNVMLIPFASLASLALKTFLAGWRIHLRQGTTEGSRRVE